MDVSELFPGIGQRCCAINVNELEPMISFTPNQPKYRIRSFWKLNLSLSCLLAVVLSLASNSVTASESPRIKRISLMTSDLDQSIAFFTEVIGFTLDFEGTLPPNTEPFLGPVFNVDSAKPIRRALLSTASEPRGLFLIEHLQLPLLDKTAPRPVVTVVQVDDLAATLDRATQFGSEVSDVITDITPEGASFAEALLMSPSGHAILVYQYDEVPAE